MMRSTCRPALLAAAGLALAAVAGWGGAERPRNTYVGSKVCFTCHISYARQWQQLEHSKALMRPGRAAAQAGCEACHGPGGRHVERREWRSDIISWTGKPAAEQSAGCLRCHQPKVTSAGWQSSPHAKLGVSCLFCHEVHKRTGHAKNLQKPQRDLCGGCHAPVLEMAKTGKHHALPEGMACTACHDPHSGARAKLLRADKKVLCRKCHAPNGARVRPTSHQDAAWFPKHGQTAKADLGRCDTCHDRRAFCNACHGTEMPHPEGWVMKHGATALKSPDACGRCHQRADCTKCHAQMPPSSHRQEGFRRRVAEEARGREALCELCHGVAMPHPANFIMEHKSKGASLAEGSPCFTCHKKEEFCSRCHPGK